MLYRQESFWLNFVSTRKYNSFPKHLDLFLYLDALHAFLFASTVWIVLAWEQTLREIDDMWVTYCKWDEIGSFQGNPTTRIGNSFCSSCSSSTSSQKSGSIFPFLYFSNMINWMSLKLLTVFLTTGLQYFLIYLYFLNGSVWVTWPEWPKGAKEECQMLIRSNPLLMRTSGVSPVIFCFRVRLKIIQHVSSQNQDPDPDQDQVNFEK